MSRAIGSGCQWHQYLLRVGTQALRLAGSGAQRSEGGVCPWGVGDRLASGARCWRQPMRIMTFVAFIQINTFLFVLIEARSGQALRALHWYACLASLGKRAARTFFWEQDVQAVSQTPLHTSSHFSSFTVGTTVPRHGRGANMVARRSRTWWVVGAILLLLGTRATVRGAQLGWIRTDADGHMYDEVALYCPSLEPELTQWRQGQQHDGEEAL